MPVWKWPCVVISTDTAGKKEGGQGTKIPRITLNTNVGVCSLDPLRCEHVPLPTPSLTDFSSGRPAGTVRIVRKTSQKYLSQEELMSADYPPLPPKHTLLSISRSGKPVVRWPSRHPPGQWKSDYDTL